MSLSFLVSGFIFLSLFFYAFSTSCPHTVGIAELGVSISFVMAVLSSFFLKNDDSTNQSLFIHHYRYIALAACLVLLVYPIFVSLINGNSTSLWGVARDIIPHMFFMLPAFFINLNRATAIRLANYLPVFIIIVGAVFSARFLFSVKMTFGSVFGFFQSQSEMFQSAAIGRDVFLSPDVLCLPFDPTVFYSGTVLVLYGLYIFLSKGKVRLLYIFGIGVLLFFPVLSFVAISSRAFFFLLTLLVLYSFLLFFINASKVKLIILLLISILLFFLFYSSIDQVITLLLAKQDAVGTNNKIEEVLAIIEAISKSDATVIFGLGWGAEFYDPAVGEVASFSHSFISYYLLKSGVTGLFLLSLYMSWVLVMLWKLLRYSYRSYFPMIAGVIMVLLIAAFLQPLYKTPSFGLILLYLYSLYKAKGGNIVCRV